MSAQEIMLKFVEEQEWEDDSVVKLLLSFLDTRSSYWPSDKPMETDLRAFLQNVADEENSWMVNSRRAREEFDNHGPDGWVFADEDGAEVGFAEPHDYQSAEHAVEKFGREYGDGDFNVYFRRNNIAYSCAADDTPALFGFFINGEKVHVDRQDDQWGRIAEDGEVVEVQDDKVLILVGGNIRANVLCEFYEVRPYK